jgi:hypothetical protein
VAAAALELEVLAQQALRKARLVPREPEREREAWLRQARLALADRIPEAVVLALVARLLAPVERRSQPAAACPAPLARPQTSAVASRARPPELPRAQAAMPGAVAPLPSVPAATSLAWRGTSRSPPPSSSCVAAHRALRGSRREPEIEVKRCRTRRLRPKAELRLL